MLIQVFTALAISASGAASGKISHTDYHFAKPDRGTSTQQLETALQRFDGDIAGKRGRSRARSSKPREIVVVGSKVKDVVRSPRARGGQFSAVQGMDSQTDVVEYRDGAPPSLPQLQGAIRRFESAAGAKSPCVRSCRSQQRRCMARCRAKLRKSRMSGRCICAHVQAHCLVQAARRNRCHPPDPGRRRRLRR